MLYDLSEDIDINKTGGLHEWIIFHFWYFLSIDFRFQTKVWNGSHNMAQKSMSSNDVAIVTVERNG